MDRIILVRHGQTQANVDRVLQGHQDGALTRIGEIQIERLARHLRHIRIDQIYSSDLQRAQKTAEKIAEIAGIPLSVDARLREWDVGELDGKPAAALFEAVERAGVSFVDFQPAGGENLTDVKTRAIHFYKDIAVSHTVGTVLITSHGDFLRVFLGLLLKKSLESGLSQVFENASYSVLEMQADGEWKVVEINQTNHLKHI